MRPNLKCAQSLLSVQLSEHITIDESARPGGVAEVLVGIAYVSVDDADKDILALPIVAQLRQPVEVVGGVDGFLIELGDHVASVYVDDDQRSERDAVVFRQSATHQIDDVCKLRLQSIPTTF